MTAMPHPGARASFSGKATMPSSQSSLGTSPSGGPLAERVRQRLDLAGQAYDRRASAALPRGRRRRPNAPSVGDALPDHHLHARERACLRAVFHELGAAHRQYRASTGQTVTPALRAATSAFKQEPSLLSLVPVVAFLDELGILAW